MSIQEQDNIQIATEGNFDEVVTGDNMVLVSFYATWSGRWKAMEDEFAQAALQLKNAGSDIRLAKVDATVETKLGEKHQIQGFPSLLFFKKGKRIDYNGGNTAPEICSWLYKKTGPPAIQLETGEQAQRFLDSHEAMVLGCFIDHECDGAKVFLKAADSLTTTRAGICTPDIAAVVGAPAERVTVFSIHREEPQVAEPRISAGELKKFIETKSRPLVFEFSDEIAPRIFNSDIKNHLLLFLSKSSPKFSSHLNTLKQIAAVYEERLMFVIVDSDIENNSRILEFFSIQPANIPAVRLVNVEGDMTKYRLAPPFTADSYSAFLTAWETGRLSPYFMSEEIPEQDAPVYALVTKSFDTEARNLGKDVFIHFYAPWADTCKQIAPIWEQLALHYAADERIRIAKMDATRNELPDIKIQSFPTLIYLRASGEIVSCNGGRDLEDLIRFVDAGGVQQQNESAEDFPSPEGEENF